MRDPFLLLIGLTAAGACAQVSDDGPGSTTASQAKDIAEVDGGAAEAVSCSVPDAVRARVPSRPVAEEWYETRWVTDEEGSQIPLGVGHVHYSMRNPGFDLPPGELDWLRSIDLPLSAAPGQPASAWITMGWVVRDGLEPEPLRRADQVETGYEDFSFIVLETQDDWLKIRYADDANGSAWVPACALDEGPILLDFARWSDWLTSGDISPLFFRVDAPDDLFAAPDENAERRAIGQDYHLEPIEVRGSWMRVLLKEPSDYCEFDMESEATEGWVRWYADDVGPRVWYYTRGC